MPYPWHLTVLSRGMVYAYPWHLMVLKWRMGRLSRGTEPAYAAHPWHLTGLYLTFIRHCKFSNANVADGQAFMAQ
eukprot:926963-Rhodomonas_salina.1